MRKLSLVSKACRGTLFLQKACFKITTTKRDIETGAIKQLQGISTFGNEMIVLSYAATK